MNDTDKLRTEIEKLTHGDEYATENIFEDVVYFDSWLFDDQDGRTNFLEIPDTLPKPLTEAVQPIVRRVLEDMESIGQLPQGSTAKELITPTSYKLVGYILNFEKWVPLRYEEEAMDDYTELQEATDDIYVDSDYGDYSNMPDNSFVDGDTDFPS